MNELNIIHVAGTKGKGSTCAFTRSLLQAHGLRTGFPRKIGLYTSPHLRNIRERIQINGKPIVKDLFTKYFFEVWDGLEARSPLVIDGKERTPRYLQLLALVAVHTFIRERMDATIIETHHGGEYDTTNFVQRPIVTGITSLGLDHVAQLGSDIESIAWHKAGIFKPGAAAFSVSQDPAAIPVLKARAAEKGTQLTFVETDPSLPTSSILEVPTQKINISLALSLANAFLERKAHPENGQLSSSDVLAGIEGFSWPGRYEIIVDGSNQWFLDGAHNELSLRQVGDWFAKATSKKKQVSFHIL